ncbi:MAG: alcohol dehydrogenase catalytic domain-containing protein [Candidatus Marinimicrobia bacterium]|nr:alcohol dehydrogenase catalytic domain-containing protein [Candidatus Neomarinimicrobiota bacterium]
MKALVLEDAKELNYTDVDPPEIRPDEVLVRVKAAGICGSDVHGMDGSTGRRIPPIIMGHEAAGVIERVGPEVTGYAAGDRVTFDSTIYCGTCWYCRRGEINLCEDRKVLGVSCGDYRQHGAFADYVAVPAHILYALPDAITFEQAAMVEPCSIAFHAVDRTPIRLNDTAVVVGTGMVGLFVVQALRLAGCGTIIAVDLEPKKLSLAASLGADITLNPNEVQVPVEVQQHTKGRGADVAFEVVGVTDTLQTALASTRKGGALTLVGNLAPTVDLPLQSVVTREITLYGSCASQGDYPACLEMIARGEIDADALRSATAPLSEGADWFHRLYAGEDDLMKVVLAP